MQPRPSLTLRKPSTISPEAVAAFVAGTEGESEPTLPAPAAVTATLPVPAAVTASPLRAVPAIEPPTVAVSQPAAPSPRTEVPSFRRASRAVVERRTRPARRRTTVYLDVDVATELAQALTHRDQELSDAVNSAVRAWLDQLR
jgi:hypothetical protein